MPTPVLLGTDKQTRQVVQLPLEARRLGTYMIGRQGSGKTNLIVQIALSDIANGDGVCVLAPHSDLTEALLARIPPDRRDDVIVFSPADERPAGFNVFSWDGPDGGVLIDTIADQVVTETFKRLWADMWGARMEEMMNNVSRTILYGQALPPEKRPTLAEFARIIGRGQDRSYRDYLTAHIAQSHQIAAVEELLGYWAWFDGLQPRFREEVASSTLNKARPFRANELVAHVVGQGHLTRLDFPAIVSEGKILLCDLNIDELSTGNAELLGSLIAGRLFLAALSRDPLASLRPFHIIADEFGFFASPAFAALQDQARKFAVDVLVAHQRRGQLDSETRDATLTAGNWIILSVNPEDAEDLAKGFDSQPPGPEIRGQHQDFQLANQPWTELQQRGHDNPQMGKLVHNMESHLFVGMSANLTKWPVVVEWLGWDELDLDGIDGVGLMVHGFPRQEYKDRFEVDLNRVLYLMMTDANGERGEEILPLFLGLAEGLYRYQPDPGRGVYFASPDPEGGPPHLAAVSGGRTGWVLAAPDGDPPLGRDWGEQAEEDLRQQIWDYVEQHGGRYGIQAYLDDEYAERKLFGQLTATCARVFMRHSVLRLVAQIGTLLREQPVWARSGQPVPDYEPQRLYSDVTSEWQNVLTNLPRFEAWCRIQEPGRVGEYHVVTRKAPDPPADGAQVAEQIRQQSRNRYGVDRAEVEHALAERVRVAALDAVAEGSEEDDEFPLSGIRDA